MSATVRAVTTALLVSLVSCRKPAPPAPEEQAQNTPTNRIAVPEAVRRNLGITFVTVERRRIAHTLRLPGHFELLPDARHEHRTPIAGRVQVLVRPLQAVKAGDVLYRIDSPEWRRMQRELGELETTLQVTEARIAAMTPLLAAHKVHEDSLRGAASTMESRVKNLEETRANIGGQAPELAAARVQLAQIQADQAEAAEKRAETDAALAELRANLVASRDRVRLAVEAASAVLGLPAAPPDGEQGGAASRPQWRVIGAMDVRATATGVVDKLPVATGVWVETGELVVTVTNMALVRFRARALQSQLPLLQAGLPARVVRPQGQGAISDHVPGTFALGIEADPTQRTLDLFLEPSEPAAWSRAGVAGFLEVETQGNATPELAVPLSSVMQDGMQRVLFRRNPEDPDQVIRIEADTGLDDGRWIEIKSGLRDGDSVVLTGAYELMLASSGSAAKAGHFHSDGTYHDKADK